MSASVGSPLGVITFPTAVLVVDDEPVIRQLFEQVLPSRGLEVVSAATGEEAVYLLRKQGFGCLLVDKNLPGIDGIAVMREARKQQPYCACIVITGYASTGSAIEALRLGATDYLEKPFSDVELLAEKVDHAMKVRKVEYERDKLLEKLRTFQAELKNAGGELSRAQTEIEMFNQVFEFRLEQATEDLQKRCRTLEDAMRSHKDLDTVVLLQLEEVLASVRALASGDDAHPSMRGVLARVARQLEAPLLTLHRGKTK